MTMKATTKTAYHPYGMPSYNLEAGTAGTIIKADNLPDVGEQRYWFTPSKASWRIMDYSNTVGYLLFESEHKLAIM